MAKTYAQKNQEYWNSAAQSAHKDRWVYELQAQISAFLIANTRWLGMRLPQDVQVQTTARLLDYACGNGIVSRSLHPLFAQCVGVDLADAMLARYRETANQLGLSESQMMTIQGDLLTHTVDFQSLNPPMTEEQLSNFDVVAICMALHHVDDLELAVRRLADRLRPGGVLLIIDWAQKTDKSVGSAIDQGEEATTLASEKTAHQQHQAVAAHAASGHSHGAAVHQHWKPHPASVTVSHDSFSREQIFALFQKAGCGEASFVLADRLSDVPGARSGKMQLFWARATKL